MFARVCDMYYTHKCSSVEEHRTATQPSWVRFPMTASSFQLNSWKQPAGIESRRCVTLQVCPDQAGIAFRCAPDLAAIAIRFTLFETNIVPSVHKRSYLRVYLPFRHRECWRYLVLFDLGKDDSALFQRAQWSAWRLSLPEWVPRQKRMI